MTIERRYFGDPFSTADMTGTTKSIRFKPNDEIILRGIKTWIIFNDYQGSFTSLQCKLYSDQSNSPGALIDTSTNSFTKAQVITYNSGVREIYFSFDDISLHPDTYYHFVLNCTGYTYAESQHIAWRKAWPDPVYRTGWTQSYENLGIAPYSLTIIGARL